MSKRQDNFEKDMKDAEALLKTLDDLKVQKFEALKQNKPVTKFVVLF